MTPKAEDYILMMNNIPNNEKDRITDTDVPEPRPTRTQAQKDQKNQKGRETKAKSAKSLPTVRSLPTMDRTM